MKTNLIGQFNLSAGDVGTDNRSRVQLMQAGRFNHPRYGEFEITDENLRQFADSIRQKGDRVSIDYDHSFAEGGNSRAAGWIDGSTAEVDGDALFADVEWTPAAADSIRSKEYRFISPEFDFTSRDYRSGQRVETPDFKAAALTNRPFLREMQPVALSDRDIFEVLDPYLLNEDEVEAAARMHGADVAASLRAAAMHGPSREDRVAARRALANAAPQTRKEDRQMKMSDFAVSLGLAEDADESTILAAAKAAREENDTLKSEVADLKTKVVPEATLKTLSDQAAAGAAASKQLHEMTKSKLLDDAIRTGKILPAQRDAYAAMYDVNADGIALLFEATPENAVVKLDETGGNGGTSENATTPKTLSVDGQELDVLESTALLHDKAVAILAADGKDDGDYTAEEYLRAVRKAGTQA